MCTIVPLGAESQDTTRIALELASSELGYLYKYSTSAIIRYKFQLYFALPAQLDCCQHSKFACSQFIYFLR